MNDVMAAEERRGPIVARVVALAVILGGLIIGTAVTSYRKFWPRLAPGTQCILVGDDRDCHTGRHVGIVVVEDATGNSCRAGLGSCVVVLEDARRWIWNRTRKVMVSTDRNDAIVWIERMYLAPLR